MNHTSHLLNIIVLNCHYGCATMLMLGCLDHKAGVKTCSCVDSYVVAAVTSEAHVQSYRSLLFFQGTADVMAGLEAIRIHSGCE